MTKTLRRRALVSSVAMLLVAMLALGSATFAWFTSDPTADATGISMSTTTGTGLLAKAATDTDGFSHHTGLDGGKDAGGAFSLQPVTFDFTADTAVTSYYKATAADEDNYAAAAPDAATSFTTTASAKSTSTDIYAERVYLKLTANAAAATVVSKMTVTLDQDSITDPLATAVRVTILGTDNKVIGTWGPSGAVANHYAHGGAFTTSTTKYTLTPSGTQLTGLSQSVSTSESANYVTVIVWLDGEDEQVYTSNASNASTLLNDVTIAFEL